MAVSKVYLTDKKEWLILGDSETPPKDAKFITSDVSYFLNKQKEFDRLYIGKK